MYIQKSNDNNNDPDQRGITQNQINRKQPLLYFSCRPELIDIPFKLYKHIHDKY